MEPTMTECLKGMASEMCWGIYDVSQRFFNFNRYAYLGLKAAVRETRSFVEGWCRRSYEHIDKHLSKRGTPWEIRKVVSVLLAVPTIVIRVAFVGVVVALWTWNAPQIAVRVTRSVVAANQYPSKKRTPKKSRPWERLDDFDDVRVRVSELTQ